MPYNIILWTVKPFKIAVAFTLSLKKFEVCELQDFHRGVAEESILQGCDTISGGQLEPNIWRQHGVLIFKGLYVRESWHLTFFVGI